MSRLKSVDERIFWLLCLTQPQMGDTGICNPLLYLLSLPHRDTRK